MTAIDDVYYSNMNKLSKVYKYVFMYYTVYTMSKELLHKHFSMS